MSVITEQGSTSESGRPFEYEIRLAANFSEALSREGEAVSVAQFTDEVLRSACTLLQARGGAGKTYTAKRLAKYAAQAAYETRLIAAASLPTTDDLQAWTFASWRSASELLDEPPEDLAGTLLIIDGLNEIDKYAGDELLDTVERLAAVNPDLALLITDRLTRRSTASRYWKLATLGPVPRQMIEDIAGEEATELHEIPFYLDRHARGHRPHEIHREELSRAISDDDAQRLATCAFETYRDRRKRTVEIERVVETIGLDAWEKLVGAGLVVVHSEGNAQFHHHLFHDYLVSSHLAAHVESWTPAGFDVVTLRASSFDALGLVVSQVDDHDAVEQLIHKIYDWNFYAAAFVLSDGAVANRIRPTTRIAILGALAEKRFDRVQPTVVRVEDALRVLGDSLARDLLACPDREKVVRLIMTEASSIERDNRETDWHWTWREMFARPDGGRLSESDVVDIRSPEPMIGWTFANTARRMHPTRAAVDRLAAIVASDAEDPTVRWRATHALGPHPGRESMKILRSVVTDPNGDRWVKYGALRSQLEHIHAEKRTIRKRDLAHVVRRQFEVIVREDSLRNELIRCLDVEPMPPHWHADIESVLLALRKTTTTARETEQLVALASVLRARKDSEQIES